MKIFERELKLADLQVLTVPWNSKMLTVQVQNGVPCIWYESDPNNSLTDIKIAIYATGQDMPDIKQTYIATFQMEESKKIYHVYLIH